MFGKKFVLLFLFVFSFLFLGCSEESVVSGDKLVIGVPSAPVSSAVFQMVEDDSFDYDYDVYVYKSVEEVNALLARDELHLVILPVNVASKLYNKLGNIQLLNVNTFGILYLVSANNISGFSDLENQELYVGAQGSSPDVLTRFFLKNEGLSDSVSLNYASSQEVASLFIAGRVDNVVLPEPLLTRALSVRDGFVVVDFFEEWRGILGEDKMMPQAGFVVSKGFADNNKELLVDFQSAFEVSLNKVISDPVIISEVVEDKLGISKDLFVSSMSRVRLGFLSAEDAQGDVLKYLEVLKSINSYMVGGVLPDDDFFFKI